MDINYNISATFLFPRDSPIHIFSLALREETRELARSFADRFDFCPIVRCRAPSRRRDDSIIRLGVSDPDKPTSAYVHWHRNVSEGIFQLCAFSVSVCNRYPCLCFGLLHSFQRWRQHELS